MSWFDIMLLGIMALSLISGFFKGILREVFSLGGVIVGILLALMFSPALKDQLIQWIPVESAAYAAAFVIIFILVAVLAELLTRVLTKVLKFAKLNFANRLLGAGFGLLRGVVIGVILAMGVSMFLDADHPVLTESKVTPYLINTSKVLMPLLPDEVEVEFREKLEELEGYRDAIKI